VRNIRQFPTGRIERIKPRRSPVEKRKSKRVSVSGDVSGRMVLVSDLDIQDLSLTGIRFHCHGRVIPESKINLLVVKDSLRVKLPGTIVRSTLKNMPSAVSGQSMGYEVAVSFNTLSPEERGALEKLIRLVEQG
jgi:hypothetical protein